jgi:hypothetical protein
LVEPSFVGVHYDLSSSVYPNPTTDNIVVRLDEEQIGKKGTIKLFDLSGNLMIKRDFNGAMNIIDIKSLKDGVYFLDVKGERGVGFCKIIRN